MDSLAPAEEFRKHPSEKRGVQFAQIPCPQCVLFAVRPQPFRRKTVKAVRILPQTFRRPCHRCRSVRNRALQCGQDLKPQDIPRTAGCKIGTVSDGFQSVLPTVTENFFLCKRQQRTHDHAGSEFPDLRNSAESVKPRSARQTEQHRFGVVVRVVRRGKQRDSPLRHDVLKATVAHLARRFLKPHAVFSCPRGNVDPHCAKIHAEPRRKVAAERLVAVCLRPANPVMDMQGKERKTVPFRRFFQKRQERNRIRAARKSDGNRRIARHARQFPRRSHRPRQIPHGGVAPSSIVRNFVY